MQNKTYTFDYHSGMIRRNLLAEGEKTVFVKKSPSKTANKGIVASVRTLFTRQ